MAEKVNIPLPEITCEDFQTTWTRFELVAAAKEWNAEKQALILPTLFRGMLYGTGNGDKGERISP